MYQQQQQQASASLSASVPLEPIVTEQIYGGAGGDQCLVEGLY